MVLYLSIISAAMAIIAAVNIAFPTLSGGAAWWEIVVATLLFTVGVIILDLLVAGLVRWLLPKKWLSRGTPLVKVGKWERTFYQKLGVKKWKDHVPELGQFTSFSKKKVYSPDDNEYVGRYIFEANAGALGHLLGMLFGFLIVVVMPAKFLWISLPVAVVNFFLSAGPMIVLRYNLPKLEVLYKRNEKRRSAE